MGPQPSIAVLMSPVNHALVEPHRLTGAALGWQWVRYFSPFVNLYAVVFLIGGAILPGIGGTATRTGYTEVLYITRASSASA